MLLHFSQAFCYSNTLENKRCIFNVLLINTWSQTINMRYFYGIASVEIKYYGQLQILFWQFWGSIHEVESCKPCAKIQRPKWIFPFVKNITDCPEEQSKEYYISHWSICFVFWLLHNMKKKLNLECFQNAIIAVVNDFLSYLHASNCNLKKCNW